MTQFPGMATGTPPFYTLRRTAYGYIAAIERNGYTVLQLQDGSTRNEEAAAAIVSRLNLTVNDEQVDELIRDILDWTAEPDDTQRETVREWLANL
ncbi:MAG: hypothetical protein DDT21_02287 [Syntrophomonadaceae bacterium]|nr:hypothetical protein [Bacillota bacterium]